MRHPFGTLLAALALLLVPMPGVSGDPAPAMSFTLVQVTNNRSEDRRPTLAVDGDGKSHVAYEGSGHIYYATNSSGSWVITRVSSDLAEEYRPAIALDGSNHACIAYYSGSPPTLNIHYATNAGGSWTSEVVGDVSMPATWNLQLGLALDGLGRAYIAYQTYDGFDYEISIRYQESLHRGAPRGGWVTLPVTENSVQDEVPSIAVTESGAIRIAYQSYDPSNMNYDIWYATHTESWSFGRVTDSAGLDDKAPSLALDRAGKAHIAWEVYSQLEPAEIGYATNASGAWLTMPVTANLDHDTNPSLTVDRTGQVHIVYEYYDWTRYHIRHTSNAGGEWSASFVASAPVQEAFLAASDHTVAVHRMGYVHVVYSASDGLDDEVWYARSDQPGSHAVYLPFVVRNYQSNQ